MLNASIEIAGWLWLICIILSLFGCIYALAAIWLVRRFAARPRAGRGQPAPVTVLKPLHGMEPGLDENLRALCRQRFPADFQLIFGVQNPDDQAIKIVESIKADFQTTDIFLVVNPGMHGSNRKISNLINMYSYAKYDLIILADSDIAVDENYMNNVSTFFSDRKTGLLTCLYYGHQTGSIWSQLACMGVCLHFLPSVMAGLATGLAKPCFGSTIALRRDTLDEIGGFHAFANHLADDYAIGAAVRNLGYHVDIPGFLVGHTFPDNTFAEMFRHELRWARTIFGIDPAGFIGSGVTHAFPLALLAAISRGFDVTAWVAVLIALGCRLLLQAQVVKALQIPHLPLWLVPLRDLVSFVVYLTCFFSSRVDWRGQTFNVHPDGTMVAAGAAQNKQENDANSVSPGSLF